MELILIAIALAMDSVAVSIATGAKFRLINVMTVLKVAFLFGFFQGFMPLLGYFLGSTFASYVDAVDHYIASAILFYLGYRMIKEGLEDELEEEISNLQNKTLLFLAIATSIDALAVGITFSFQAVDILSAVSLIGLITFALCVVAAYIGKHLGGYLENKAEFLGGGILMLLGAKILLEGLM